MRHGEPVHEIDGKFSDKVAAVSVAIYTLNRLDGKYVTLGVAAGTRSAA